MASSNVIVSKTLALLLASVVAGFVGIAPYALVANRESMVSERIGKLTAIVEPAVNLAGSLEKDVEATEESTAQIASIQASTGRAVEIRSIASRCGFR